MAKRIARGVVAFDAPAIIIGQAAVGGKMEQEGPLGHLFTQCFAHEREATWEKDESALQRAAIQHAFASANCTCEDIDLHLGGDLINQCTATSFALREEKLPFAGIYAACANFALSLLLAAQGLDNGGLTRASCCGSSHFCAAEKQFRFPLELGVQPPPTAQHTATAAGAIVLAQRNEAPLPRITAGIFGHVIDLGINDPNEMGAAMAPAAWDTLRRFLQATNTSSNDYDCILTGDLSQIGSSLLIELAQTEAGFDISKQHSDCGTMLYDLNAQNVGTGGSGLGCSAAVLCADILPKLHRGELNRVLFIGTGALLSAISPLQGESIPAIAHGILLEA